MKDVKCYELFGGIAHKNHVFSFSFHQVCGKKRRRRSKGDTWWWNKEVKEAVLRKKERSTQGNVTKQY